MLRRQFDLAELDVDQLTPQSMDRIIEDLTFYSRKEGYCYKIDGPITKDDLHRLSKELSYEIQIIKLESGERFLFVGTRNMCALNRSNAKNIFGDRKIQLELHTHPLRDPNSFNPYPSQRDFRLNESNAKFWGIQLLVAGDNVFVYSCPERIKDYVEYFYKFLKSKREEYPFLSKDDDPPEGDPDHFLKISNNLGEGSSSERINLMNVFFEENPDIIRELGRDEVEALLN